MLPVRALDKRACTQFGAHLSLRQITGFHSRLLQVREGDRWDRIWRKRLSVYLPVDAIRFRQERTRGAFRERGATSAFHPKRTLGATSYVIGQCRVFAAVTRSCTVTAIVVFLSGHCRSGRSLRKIADGDASGFGDTWTLADPAVVDQLSPARRNIIKPA